MNERLLLGLTGPYCAGKNFAGKILAEKGFAVLDVDKLGHAALEKQKEAVTARFGSGVLGADGRIDRRSLGECVFGNPAGLAALENIVHPEANRLTLEWIASRKGIDCVINAALLHRSSAFTMLDAVIFIRAPYIARMFRARKRDGLPFREIWRRFNSQRFNIYYSGKKTDIYYINNCGFGFFSPLNRLRFERRLDEILSAARC
ncbi:MAG: dephospho-CoA kinase [Spirochaetaceae bacterium]|jgi:dephospho-CoA kinase|nr:dephospho-CoA kinase [Spirochaetaceae bacterium]